MLGGRSKPMGSVVLLLLVLLPGLLNPHPGAGASGVLVGVDLQAGILVLENGDDHRRLPIDVAARLHDAVGNLIDAADLRPGDVIDYVAEMIDSMWLATAVTVAWRRDVSLAPLAAVDAAIARPDIAAADRAWREAHARALRSRDHDQLLAVGDAALRVAAAACRRQPYLTLARTAYRAALLRAQAVRSVDGLLRVAAAFRGLGDHAVADGALRIARGLSPTAPWIADGDDHRRRAPVIPC